MRFNVDGARDSIYVHRIWLKASEPIEEGDVVYVTSSGEIAIEPRDEPTERNFIALEPIGVGEEGCVTRIPEMNLERIRYQRRVLRPEDV